MYAVPAPSRFTTWFCHYITVTGIKVFDRESCKCVRMFELKVGVRVKEINWSDDDQHLCLRDKDDYFTVWDVGTGEKVFETKKDPADKDWERQWKLEFYHPSYPNLWREKDSEKKGSWSFLNEIEGRTKGDTSSTFTFVPRPYKSGGESSTSFLATTRSCPVPARARFESDHRHARIYE